MIAPTDAYRARLVRVIDGDTLECDVDLGFDVTFRARVRVRNLQAPELREPDGPMAALRAELALRAARTIVLVPAQTTTGHAVQTFGRTVADVYVDGRLLADVVRGPA